MRLELGDGDLEGVAGAAARRLPETPRPRWGGTRRLPGRRARGWSRDLPSIRDAVGGLRTPCPCQVPRIMLRPAIRAAKALRGRDSTSAAGPCSTTWPSVEHDDPVGEQQRVEHVVGDDDDGPVGEHPPQRLAQGGGDRHVERGHRLVEQQQPGSAARARATATRWA